jgi:bisphosphoglycerate-independent phosphoglycerate mutase (AlkP superfamily)
MAGENPLCQIPTQSMPQCPPWDQLLKNHHHASITTSGLAVGLPDGQMGNSEVGHMNLGAGRTVYQNLTRISKAIDDGDFYKNPVLVQALWQAVMHDKAVHILGLVSPGGVHCHIEHIESAYQRGESDEFVQAILIGIASDEPCKIKPGDTVVFMNFRPDRARQLSRAFVDMYFDAFERPRTLTRDEFVTLTQYADDIDAPCAYPPQRVANSLGGYLSRAGKKQLRIAETDKYAHVTFFFNGGREKPFNGESRQLVPSPRVASYDLLPEMSAQQVAEHLVSAIHSQQYDLVVCNYANGDMVGHTGKSLLN